MKQKRCLYCDKEIYNMMSNFCSTTCLIEFSRLDRQEQDRAWAKEKSRFPVVAQKRFNEIVLEELRKQVDLEI